MLRPALILLLFALAAEYSCTSLSWQRLQTQAVAARNRWYAGFVHYKGSLFLFGGEGSKDSNSLTGGVLGDTWKLTLTDPITDPMPVWSPVNTPTGPSARFGVVGGVVENYWIITHGCNSNTCFGDTWYMDLSASNLEWNLLINSSISSGPIPEARLTVAGGIYPGSSQLWLSMGENVVGRKLSDAWVLEINVTDGISGVWREIAPGGGLNQYHPFLPHARFLHSGVPINVSTFAIFGGCASGGQVGGPCPLQDSWTLDLDTAEWSPLPVCAPPTVRHSMTAVPNRPGSAFVIGGSQSYTPGVFIQYIQPVSYNETLIYVLDTINGTGIWKSVAVAGDIPDHREGASLAVDDSTGVVYLIGGRTTNDSLFQLDLWMLSGNAESDPGAPCPTTQFTYIHLHGLFMYMAWGLFLPLGVLLGRYYRWSWPFWFVLHLLCQSLGVLTTVAGFVVIFLVGSYSSPDFPHAIVGIVLTFILIQQFLSGIFHPCVDKENGKTPTNEKSKYRKCWEVYHAVSGFISIAIGFGQIMLGVLLIGAPLLVWAIWAGLAGLWILVFLLHECIYICYKLCHKRKRVY